MPAWAPMTRLERLHYHGEDGNKTECWAGIRKANSISAWMSEEIERRRNKAKSGQVTNPIAIATALGSKVDTTPGLFNSNTLGGLTMPGHIVGYSPPENTVPPTTLSREESGPEGDGSIGPGWSRESMEEAWSRFHPYLGRRHVERDMSVLEALDGRSRDASESGSEGGSIRTVRLGIAENARLKEEHEREYGYGSGSESSESSNSSTGTVRYVGERDESAMKTLLQDSRTNPCNSLRLTMCYPHLWTLI